MLGDLEGGIDDTGGRMDMVMTKLNKVVNHRDGGKLCMIFVLVIVLVLLVYFIF